MSQIPSTALLRFLRQGLQRSTASCQCHLAAHIHVKAQTLSAQGCERHARRTCSYQSATAVSASKNIPAGFRRLHVALQRLRKDASSYVDLSRLELASRGLESFNPAIRVAFLGLSSFTSVRRLARALLADPLEPTTEWEKRLASLDWQDNRSLLLRCGDETEDVPSSAILAIQHIPSRVLQKNNTEILLSTIPSADAASLSAASLNDAALMPMVGTPMSFSGNVSLIRHPVHRALVVAEGLRGCAHLGRWTRSGNQLRSAAAPVKGVLDIHYESPEKDDSGQEEEEIPLVNVKQAVESLNSLRLSKDNAPRYAEGWKSSGIQGIADWLQAGSERHRSGLPVAVEHLVEDILREAERSLQADREARAPRQNHATTGEAIAELGQAVSDWARRGHVELRNGLEKSVTGKDWSRLRWWKLFWRVDDVAMILAQLVDRHWLHATERGLLWLEGRCTEAGLESSVWLSSGKDSVRTTQAKKDGEAELIEQVRSNLLSNSLPTLEMLAQAMVLQTASLTTLSSVFAALVYLSFPTVTAIQAGAFAALGMTWSLRRMQRKWEDARDTWIEDLRETGRKSLRDTEDSLRNRLAKGFCTQFKDVQTVEDLELAAAAILDAKEALAELNDSQSRP